MTAVLEKALVMAIAALLATAFVPGILRVGNNLSSLLNESRRRAFEEVVKGCADAHLQGRVIRARIFFPFRTEIKATGSTLVVRDLIGSYSHVFNFTISSDVTVSGHSTLLFEPVGSGVVVRGG